jgi:signal transduction histidine kinase
VPFKTGAQVAGALTWMRMPSSAPYTGEELLLAEEVARRAGLAVEHARLFAEAQEANRIKDNFLATLSHELRTPLNAIIGWAQVLLEHEAEAEPQRHGLEVVLRNARAQEQIVSDVLDVSRIVSGKIRLDAAATDVVEVVDAAVEATRLPADARHVEVRFVRPSQPVIIAGDARRLQQVVWNLLANAIKFTPNGGRVEVAVEGGPEWIQVLVSDTGIGIDPAFLPRIFDRFAQAGDSITRGSGGLGLGLSIVRHIVELHEGTVSAASEGEGRGATFTVRLPVSPRRRQAGAVADIPAESGRSDPSSAHLAGLVVLVVDDDRDARDVLEMVLRRAAADVMSAASVREAVACVRERTPDVVISDIGMPHEDGYSLIGKLRALGVAAPAIALTASVGADDERRAMEAGYQIHVPKPVTPARLLELVAAASRLHDQTS